MIQRAPLRACAMALGLALGLLAAQASAGECRPDLLELRGDFGTGRFTVEVVDTPDSRAKGLMFRESMASGAGMLFVYEKPQSVAFWMKNTLIPLDMIFAGADGTVRHVHSNAVPGDLTAIPGGDDIQFVLEINGGLAKAIGLAPGVELRHPAIPAETAAWPC